MACLPESRSSPIEKTGVGGGADDLPCHPGAEGAALLVKTASPEE